MTPTYWLGTDQSLHDFILRHEQPIPDAVYGQVMGLFAGQDPEDDPEDPWEEFAAGMLSVHDGVGIIEISGPMVADENFFGKLFFNETAYPTVIRAVNQALENDEVHTIMLSLDTPGGDARGVSETADAIKAAGTVKPVYAWASVANSAGYWLASAASEGIYAAKTSNLGSIGAVTSFMGYAEKLKTAGIEVAVIRSSPLKAVPSPLEPLSEVGRQKMQDNIDTLAGFFVDAVVQNRPTLSSGNSRETWASGSSFFGPTALQYGLINELLTGSSELIARICNEEQNSQTTSEGSYPMSKRIVLSAIPDLSLARVAMGLTPEGAPIAPIQAAADPTPEPTPEPEAIVTTLESTPSDFATYLKDEIAALKAANLDLQTKLAELAPLQGQLQTAESTIGHLRPVAEAAVNRLSIGLGHRPSKLEHVPADLLAATFQDLQGELMKLPVGRQTAEPEIDTIEGDSGPETLAQHRLRLVPSAVAGR